MRSCGVLPASTGGLTLSCVESAFLILLRGLAGLAFEGLPLPLFDSFDLSGSSAGLPFGGLPRGLFFNSFSGSGVSTGLTFGGLPRLRFTGRVFSVLCVCFLLGIV